MCSKFKLYWALMLLPLAISLKPIAAILEDDIASAASAPTVQQKFIILTNAWNNLESVQPYNMTSMVYLQKNFIFQLIENKQNLSFTLAQRRVIDRFDEKIRNVIINSYGKITAQVLNIKSDDSLNVQYLQRMGKIFEHDSGTTLKIFEHAIDEIYGIKKTSVLAQYLSFISVADPQTADLQIDAQHYLQRKYLNRGDIDEEYLMLIASYLRSYKLASNLSRKRRQRLNEDIASLPMTLQYLFFGVGKKVCMKNVGYNEFLYEFKAADDTTKSEVFTRPNQNYIDVAGHWSFEPGQQDYNAGDLSFTGEIKNVNFQHLLYRDRSSNNRVFASANPWVTQVYSNIVWFFNLRNNNLVLSQEELVLCATNTTGETWRHVYAILSTVDDAPAECQWSLDICPPVPMIG